MSIQTGKETQVLTDAQIQQYKQQGFLVVENILTHRECDEITQRAVDMLEGKVPFGDRNAYAMDKGAVDAGLTAADSRDPYYLNKIGHFMHQTDVVFRYYAMHNHIADVLNDLIGPDIKCIQTMYIDKAPGGIGAGQPYHQDSYYLRNNPDTTMGVWLALDDVDEENGCLHVIPGSHLEELHEHEFASEDQRNRGYLEVVAARGRTEQACILPKGSAVFFPGKTLHRSGNNNTQDRRRRAYVIHYADAHSTSEHPDIAYNPHLLVRGRQYPGCL